MGNIIAVPAPPTTISRNSNRIYVGRLRPDSVLYTRIGFTDTRIDHVHEIHIFVAIVVVQSKVNVRTLLD